MGKGKNDTAQVGILGERTFAPTNKSTEFGQVPPSLNTAGQLFQGGNTPPSLNLAGEFIKGMVPQSLAKIPLDQVPQPSQPSSGNPSSPGSTSADSGSGQSAGSGKE